MLEPEVLRDEIANLLSSRPRPRGHGHHTTELVLFAKHVEGLLEQTLDVLREEHEFGCVVTVPSRTWARRQEVGDFIAEYLGLEHVPVLDYAREPEQRQGQLHNNDQRRDNVRRCFAAQPAASRPGAAMLLVDDYVGSRATLKEVATVLRKQLGWEDEIVPLVLARVRWKLGSSGMI